MKDQLNAHQRNGALLSKGRRGALIGAVIGVAYGLLFALQEHPAGDWGVPGGQAGVGVYVLVVVVIAAIIGHGVGAKPRPLSVRITSGAPAAASFFRNLQMKTPIVGI